MKYTASEDFMFTSKSTFSGFGKGIAGKLSFEGRGFGTNLDKLEIDNDVVSIELSKELGDLAVSLKPTLTPAGPALFSGLAAGADYGTENIALGLELDATPGNGFPLSAQASYGLGNFSFGVAADSSARTLDAGILFSHGPFTCAATTEENPLGRAPSALNLGAAYELPGGVLAAATGRLSGSAPKPVLSDKTIGGMCTFGSTMLKVRFGPDALSLACVHQYCDGISINPTVSAKYSSLATEKPTVGLMLNLG